MIPHGVQIFLALETIDMRLSFDRLAGLCQERIGCDARSRALFVFLGRRREALKVFFFDGTGMCQFYKRLDRGTFRLPEPQQANDSHVELEESVLDALLDGIDIAVPSPKAKHRNIH